MKPVRIAKGRRPRSATDENKKERQNLPQPPQTLTDDSEILDSLRTEPFDGTLIFVHGIGNKPVASTLKCQWDRALFGTGMGQRTRMVHWVNRERYPEPLHATCDDPDHAEGLDPAGIDEHSVLQDRSAVQGPDDADIASMIQRFADRHQGKQKRRVQQHLTQLAETLAASTADPWQGPRAEVLPLPRWARDRLTRMFTRLLLEDVYDYLFVPDVSEQIDRKFTERLHGGGPFIVVGHSLGSVIAFRNLCRTQLSSARVRLFLTLGSPLGMQEIQDQLKQILNLDQLEKPECIDKWINLADRFDPVAADLSLANDIDRSIVDYRVANLDRPRHPHSATGYLGISTAKAAVRRIVGPAFAQPVSSFSVARDLTDKVEDSITTVEDGGSGPLPETHPVLIELSRRGGRNLTDSREELLRRMEETLGTASFAKIKITHLARYLSAELTGFQIESLGPVFKQYRVGRIWNDSHKNALSFNVAEYRQDPVHAVAAERVYQADGAGIRWAVLDTGVESRHPHFQIHRNIAEMIDCTHHEPEMGVGVGDPVDQHGHGTHVAAIIAGQVDSRTSSNKALNGVAPKTLLHSYKVLDDAGRGRDSYIIRALDHIASVNEQSGSHVIHGVNLSLGGPFDPETYGCGHSPICRELRRLWRQGVLIVIAAGNAGFAELKSGAGTVRTNLDLSIGDPANLEESIAVGSVHLQNPLTYGTSFFSSRGPTADGRQKPDLVAPGERVPSANYAFEFSDPYVELSGTSMAAPHVSGLLAAFLSQRREFIGEPDRVKKLLLENCTSLDRDPYVQGAGVPNLIRMLMAT